jgi:hypothetical protein
MVFFHRTSPLPLNFCLQVRQAYAAAAGEDVGQEAAAAAAAAADGKRKPVDGAECPICYEELKVFFVSGKQYGRRFRLSHQCYVSVWLCWWSATVNNAPKK